MPSPGPHAGKPPDSEPGPASDDKEKQQQQQQHRPPLWGVFGWIGDVAKVVTGGGGGGDGGHRGANGKVVEGADGAAMVAPPADEIAAEEGEAGPKDLSASRRQGSPSTPLSPRERKASETAAELDKTRAAAAAAALAATASMAGADGGGSGDSPVAMSAAATAKALEAAQRAAAAARDPRKDPEYAKFFSMLEAGVARETVELAMLMEGKYPAVLNTPVPGPAVKKVTSTAASEAAQVALAWAERDPSAGGSGRPFRRDRRTPSERRNNPASSSPLSRSPRERRSSSSRSPRDRRRPRRPPPSQTAEAAAEAAREAVDSLVPARKNPLYARFFEMLASGTPRAEVAAAMERDGVDAAVLDAPDALFPLPSSAPDTDTATSYAVEGAEAAAAKAAKASRDESRFSRKVVCVPPEPENVPRAFLFLCSSWSLLPPHVCLPSARRGDGCAAEPEPTR